MFWKKIFLKNKKQDPFAQEIEVESQAILKKNPALLMWVNLSFGLVLKTTEGYSGVYGNGFLLSPWWGASVAHCFFNRRTGRPLLPSSIAILHKGDIVPLESYFTHPLYKFDATSSTIDLAVVKLSKQVDVECCVSDDVCDLYATCMVDDKYRAKFLSDVRKE